MRGRARGSSERASVSYGLIALPPPLPFLLLLLLLLRRLIQSSIFPPLPPVLRCKSPSSMYRLPQFAARAFIFQRRASCRTKPLRYRKGVLKRRPDARLPLLCQGPRQLARQGREHRKGAALMIAICEQKRPQTRGFRPSDELRTCQEMQ